MKANALPQRTQGEEEPQAAGASETSVSSVAMGFRDAAAFTLIEVMMLTALLAVVIGITTAFLASMSNSVTSEMVEGDLDTRSARRLSALAEELADCRVWDPDPGAGFNAWKIAVWYPADIDLDDNILNDVAAGTCWGVRGLRDAGDTRTEHAGEWPGHVEYYFEPNTSGAVLNEGALGDINGDHVPNDVFVRGWLMRRWVRTDAGAPVNPRTQKLLSGVVQRETTVGGGDFGADIDEDSVNDPIFSMAAGGKCLTISLWLYGRDERGRPLLKQALTRIELPNQP